MDKRCATCGQVYDGEFDGCPHCAAAAMTQQALSASAEGCQALGCALMLLPIAAVWLFFALSTCSR